MIISSINLSPTFCMQLRNFMVFVNSSVGTFEYMFSMSNAASLVLLSMVISFKAFKSTKRPSVNNGIPLVELTNVP